MKKTQWILVSILMLILSFVSCKQVQAEDLHFDDQEQVLNYLITNHPDSIEFSCSADLYASLRDQDFRGLGRLMLRAGLDPQVWFSYSDKSYVFSINHLYYLDFDYLYADCESVDEVVRFISQLPADCNAYVLLCTHELLTQLTKNNTIDWINAQCGISYSNVKYSNTSDYIITKYIERFNKEYAVVNDYAEFAAAIENFEEKGINDFYVVFDTELFDKITKDDTEMRIMTGSSKMTGYGASIDKSQRAIHYYSAEFSDAPREICRSVEDVSDAFLRMGALGADKFELIFLDLDVYNAIAADKFALLHEIEARCGVVKGDISYRSSGFIYYENAEITQSSEMVQTLSDAAAYTEKQIAEGNMDLHLFCTPELYDLLIGDLGGLSFGRRKLNRITDLMVGNGVSDYDITASKTTHLISIHINEFFPGTSIIKAVQTGDSSGLTARQMETWQAAEEVAASVRDLDPLARAGLIHDWICEHVIYIDDSDTDEDDNAIGAILNGEANCDGYTDAFYLIGSLAGLNIRYQHGNSKERSVMDSLSFSTHVWNLLEIDGVWHMVDVTWDDEKDGMVHIWFNAGMDIAERIHIWNRDMYVEIAPDTERSFYGPNEFYVRSEEDAENAVYIASQQYFTNFYVIFEDPSLAGLKDEVVQSVMDKSADRMISYYWDEYVPVLGFQDFRWK